MISSLWIWKCCQASLTRESSRHWSGHGSQAALKTLLWSLRLEVTLGWSISEWLNTSCLRKWSMSWSSLSFADSTTVQVVLGTYKVFLLLKYRLFLSKEVISTISNRSGIASFLMIALLDFSPHKTLSRLTTARNRIFHAISNQLGMTAIQMHHTMTSHLSLIAFS